MTWEKNLGTYCSVNVRIQSDPNRQGAGSRDHQYRSETSAGRKAEGGWETTIMRAMHDSTQNDRDKDTPKIPLLVHREDMKSAPKDKLKKGP